MGQTRDFRFNSGNALQTGLGYVTVWANPSGYLQVTNPTASTSYGIGNIYTQTLAVSDMTNTGVVLFSNNVGTMSSGKIFGGTGTTMLTSLLGQPLLWLSVLGPSGITGVVPFYRNF